MLKSLKFNYHSKRWPWEGNNEKIKMVVEIIQYHLSFTKKKKNPIIPTFVEKKPREQRWLTTDRIQGDSRTSWCRDWYRGSQSDVGTGVTSPQTASWRRPGKSSGDISPPVDTSAIINKKNKHPYSSSVMMILFSIKVMAKLHRKLEISGLRLIARWGTKCSNLICCDCFQSTATLMLSL